MNRVFLKKNIAVYFLITAFYFEQSFTRIKYGSTSSVIKVGGNSTFKTSNPTTVKKGKMEVASTAQVKGNLVSLDGVLAQGDGGAQLKVKGSYDPSDGPFGTIFLQGNNSVVATTPGAVRSNIVISGQDNEIKGSISFDGTVSLSDQNSQVTLKLNIPLNTTIVTPNGGRVDLGQDLKLSDNVQLPSSDIAFNGNQLALGGKTPKFTSTTRFLKGADLVLNGKAELDGGTWIFTDESVLNGNGNLLDLKNGGTLELSTGTTLQLTNVVLRNMDQDSLIFNDNTSVLELSSSTVEVVNTVTTTAGAISVVGASTVIVKDGSWTVTQGAQMLVDGVSVMVDTSVNPNLNALYVDPHFTNNGTIQYLFIDSVVYLFAGVMTSTIITVTSSFIVPQGNTMSFGATTTVDALGGTIIFTAPENPQVRLLPNTSVTFQNITLQNITKNTFYIDPTSTLVFGKNVYLQLSSDITFSQGLVMFDNPGGSVFIQGDFLNTIYLEPAPGHVGPLFDIGTTSLVLENIILIGPQYISYDQAFDDNGDLITGTVILGGDTLVDVDSDLDLYFLIEKFNNFIRFKRNNIHLSGGISFKDTGENELGLAFLPFAPIGNEFPRVYFADNYLYVGSASGRGKLIFDNFGFEIFNEGGNSFLLDVGGSLYGQNLTVNNFPIKLLSNNVVIDSNMVLVTDQFNAIETSFVRHPADLCCNDEKIDEVVRGPAVTQSAKKVTVSKKGNKRAILEPANPTTYVNTIQLSDAQGEIIIKNTEVTKFGVSGISALNITLQDGGVLNQREDLVTLKSIDNINVVGLGNKIIVNDQFILEGQLLFDENADLTFVFENNGQLKIGANFSLESGVDLLFSGEGTIVLQDDVTITLKKGKTSSAKNSTLQFANGALCLVDQNASAFIDGEGTIQCYNTGGFLLNQNSLLGIGKSITDNLKIEVNQGQIIVGATSSAGDFAELSFGYGTYSIDVQLGGYIAVLENGNFACNVRNEEKLDGLFKKFALRFGSSFYIHPAGAFTLGDNTLSKNSTHSKQKSPEPIAIDTMSGAFRGTGLIRYFNKTSKTVPVFEAELGAVESSLYFYDPAFEMQKFSYRLAQQSSILKESLFFIDAAGKKKLLTKKGVIVQLQATDEVLSENTVTGDIGIINRSNQDSHIIRADGSRV